MCVILAFLKRRLTNVFYNRPNSKWLFQLQPQKPRAAHLCNQKGNCKNCLILLYQHVLSILLAKTDLFCCHRWAGSQSEHAEFCASTCMPGQYDQRYAQRIFLVATYTHAHTIEKNLQGPSLHIWPSDVERNSDIKLIRHRFSLHQPKLTNMITMICCVYYICIVQFTSFNQCVVNLKKKKKQKTHSICFTEMYYIEIWEIIFSLCVIYK